MQLNVPLFKSRAAEQTDTILNYFNVMVQVLILHCQSARWWSGENLQLNLQNYNGANWTN